MTEPQAHPDHRTGRLEAYLAAYTERWGRRPADVPEYVPDPREAATMSLTLTLPVAVPFSEVANANDARREHWGTKSRKARALRARGALAYRLAGSPRMDVVRCSVQVYYPDRRKRDVANLHPTVKALVDGMVKAGLLPDDDDAHLTGPHLEHGRDDVTPPMALWDLPPSAKPFLFVLTFTATPVGP
jgi:Holliday junction resolvase RusA-like endonuclease